MLDTLIAIALAYAVVASIFMAVAIAEGEDEAVTVLWIGVIWPPILFVIAASLLVEFLSKAFRKLSR